MISVSTALIFPVILVAALWPLGLTGIWLNFAATAVLAAVLSLIIILKRKRNCSHRMNRRAVPGEEDRRKKDCCRERLQQSFSKKDKIKIGVTGFEPATSRPPAERAYQTTPYSDNENDYSITSAGM